MKNKQIKEFYISLLNVVLGSGLSVIYLCYAKNKARLGYKMTEVLQSDLYDEICRIFKTTAHFIVWAETIENENENENIIDELNTYTVDDCIHEFYELRSIAIFREARLEFNRLRQQIKEEKSCINFPVWDRHDKASRIDFCNRMIKKYSDEV